MAVLSRIAAAGFVLAIPIFLVTTNVRFLASDTGFYERGFRKYAATEATGVSLNDLDRSAGEIVAYFENDAPTLRIIVTQDGQEVSLFNSRETEHMKDVKSLMRVVYRLNEISLAFILMYVIGVFAWSGERPVRALALQAVMGVGVGAVALLAVGAFAFAGFDRAWTRFHEVVFNNDFWRLNPATDHLIQMFPERFWEEATVIVGVLTAAEALVIVAASVTYLVFGGKEGRTATRRPALSAPEAARPASR
jgi:integral membrane protein (TIGR01906 family)